MVKTVSVKAASFLECLLTVIREKKFDDVDDNAFFSYGLSLLGCVILTRMPITMLEEMWQDPIPQALHVLLSEVLQEVPLRASGVLWEQSCVPLLQQLEDQGRRTQVPLSFFTFHQLLLSLYNNFPSLCPLSHYLMLASLLFYICPNQMVVIPLLVFWMCFNFMYLGVPLLVLRKCFDVFWESPFELMGPFCCITP